MAIEPGNSWLPALWDAPPWIRAGISTRHGGGSREPYHSLNLALHVGDDPARVTANRNYLSTLLELPRPPVWLNQTHSNKVINADNILDTDADGIFTSRPGIVCAVMTADCVPLLLCNDGGTKVAAVHVGWRGFCAGIIHNALDYFNGEIETMLAWIGPHISADHYEVGEDVRTACITKHPALDRAFRGNPAGRWQANLDTLVRQELVMSGARRIFSAGLCTYECSADFFSYRRNHRTGRIAGMIWIDK
jgi:YfiH family protein